MTFVILDLTPKNHTFWTFFKQTPPPELISVEHKRFMTTWEKDELLRATFCPHKTDYFCWQLVCKSVDLDANWIVISSRQTTWASDVTWSWLYKSAQSVKAKSAVSDSQCLYLQPDLLLLFFALDLVWEKCVYLMHILHWTNHSRHQEKLLRAQIMLLRSKSKTVNLKAEETGARLQTNHCIVHHIRRCTKYKRRKSDSHDI